MIAEALAFAAAAGAALAAGEAASRQRAGGTARTSLGVLVGVGRRMAPRGTGPLGDLDRRLVQAGRPGGLVARDFLAVKLAAALGAAAPGLAAAAVLPGRLALLVGAGAPVAGFVAPDGWLARRARERAAAVRRDLPALLDLLCVTVEAGVSLPAALAEVGRRSRSPLARLWAAIAAQAAVGVPLPDALAAHARELPLPEIRSFTAALARSSRHGVPLGDTLAAQAREARLARRRAVQEEAARAGPKIQLVVALLLVPSVMLLVAAALVSALAPDAGALLSGY